MGRPAKLYKYQSASLQDIANLSAGKVWFSQPASFNDPFDCAYDVKIPELSRADCVNIVIRASHGRVSEKDLEGVDDESLTRQVVEGFRHATQTGQKALRGVLCLSAVHDNLLMWSHYARGHCGFCLEFSTSSEPLFRKAMPVLYTDAIPALDPQQFASGDFEQAMRLLLMKAKCWEYEQEWRILHDRPDILFGYKRSSLTGVYFGAKMPEDQRMMIGALLGKTDTKLYRMKLSKSSFALESEEITFTPTDFRQLDRASN